MQTYSSRTASFHWPGCRWPTYAPRCACGKACLPRVSIRAALRRSKELTPMSFEKAPCIAVHASRVARCG